MDESNTRKIYVWEGIDSVEYISIIDKSETENEKEILCPVTADTINIASEMSKDNHDAEITSKEQNKEFKYALNGEY